jgi:HEPN domain-containing protein
MASTNEITVSLVTAEEHLKDAIDSFHRGRYHDCAYHSASAAENAGNALILALGGRVPRKHRNAEAIEFLVSRLKPDWLKINEFQKMLENLRDLEVHIVKSRYPIKIREGVFVPPSDYYTTDITEDMLKKATFIVNMIRRFLALLRSKKQTSE